MAIFERSTGRSSSRPGPPPALHGAASTCEQWPSLLSKRPTTRTRRRTFEDTPGAGTECGSSRSAPGAVGFAADRRLRRPCVRDARSVLAASSWRMGRGLAATRPTCRVEVLLEPTWCAAASSPDRRAVACASTPVPESPGIPWAPLAAGLLRPASCRSGPMTGVSARTHETYSPVADLKVVTTDEQYSAFNLGYDRAGTRDATGWSRLSGSCDSGAIGMAAVLRNWRSVTGTSRTSAVP